MPPTVLYAALTWKNFDFNEDARLFLLDGESLFSKWSSFNLRAVIFTVSMGAWNI